MHVVGQGFHALLSSANTLTSELQSGPSISERLQVLAGELRDWLSQNGVKGPFSIQIELPQGEEEARVTVDGMESQRVHALLSAEPERLEALKEIVSLSGQAGQWGPLGLSNSRAIITDASSSLIY